MHPDDQPPAPPERRPSYPAFLESLTVAYFVALVIGLSGADTWSTQWWVLFGSAILFTTFLRMFIKRLMRWFLSSIHIKITRERD